MKFANGDSYDGMWKHDQMCDPEGIYTYKNGIEYRGQLKTCSKIAQGKFGIFEGAGTLIIPKVGTFNGYFKNNAVHGPGEFITLQGKTIEKNWQNCPVDDLVIEL